MANKILIVDDEPSITIPLQFLMEQNQFEVMVVHSGEEALSAIERFVPDLITRLAIGHAQRCIYIFTAFKISYVLLPI